MLNSGENERLRVLWPMHMRVNELITQHRLFTQGDRIIVAVSGGPDSVCLLQILHTLSACWSWSLIVAHMDHGFRGPASQADSEFVRRMAQELGWPAVIKRVDVPAWLRLHGGSPQDASRRLRYSFLREVAENEGANTIALAHNQGDQAETVLLHLLRGAGAAGLAGMRYREELGAVSLVRPLLTSSRDEIMQYLKQHRIPFRVDESNTRVKYTRNRLRQIIIPGLRQINPEVESAIARTAKVLQAETDYLQQEALRAYREVTQVCDQSIALKLAGLTALPLALLRRVLRLAFTELAGDDRDLTLTNVDAAIALLGRPGSSLDWPRNLVCQVGYDLLQIGFRSGSQEFSVSLAIPGKATWGDGSQEITARLLPREKVRSFGDARQVVCLDREVLGSSVLQIRNWREGDRFQPLGMTGSRKLQDFFIDAKVDRWARQSVPLVTDGREIVWVVGHRMDHRFRVTPCTNEVVCLEYRKNGV